MAERADVLKKGDEVYIKPWKAYGKVVHAKPVSAGEPEDDGIYKVQVDPRFFRRSDLELDTTEADKAEREQRLAEKIARKDAAFTALQEAINSGTARPAVFMEYAVAMNDVSKELGIPPLFIQEP